MHGAALAIGPRPQLLDRLDQPRRAVTDHQPGRAQSAPCQIATKVEPILAGFTLAESDGHQDALA